MIFRGFCFQGAVLKKPVLFFEYGRAGRTATDVVHRRLRIELLAKVARSIGLILPATLPLAGAEMAGLFAVTEFLATSY